MGLRKIYKNEFIITSHNNLYYNNIRGKNTSVERNVKIINWKGFVKNKGNNCAIALLSRDSMLRTLKLAWLS